MSSQQKPRPPGSPPRPADHAATAEVAGGLPDGARERQLPQARIELESIAERVYQLIRRDIAHGRYKPGVLRIRPLAERFGVSPTPIREALRRLEAEGLVTVRNRRIMVRSVSPEELREIFAVRGVLEGFAISEAAAGHHDRDLFPRLESLVTAMDESASSDPDAWRAENEEFHMLIYGVTGNTRLMTIIDSLWVAVEPYLRMYVQAAPRLTEAQEEHRRMLDALRARDGGRAAEVLATHLAATEATVQRGLAQEAAK